MSFIFAVTIRLYVAAARCPPRSEPANSHDFLQGQYPKGAFGSIVWETGADGVSAKGKVVAVRETWRLGFSGVARNSYSSTRSLSGHHATIANPQASMRRMAAAKKGTCGDSW